MTKNFINTNLKKFLKRMAELNMEEDGSFLSVAARQLVCAIASENDSAHRLRQRVEINIYQEDGKRFNQYTGTVAVGKRLWVEVGNLDFRIDCYPAFADEFIKAFEKICLYDLITPQSFKFTTECNGIFSWIPSSYISEIGKALLEGKKVTHLQGAGYKYRFDVIEKEPFLSKEIQNDDYAKQLPKDDKQDRVRKILFEKGYLYCQQIFVEKCGQGDIETVGLFLEAGMSPDAKGISKPDFFYRVSADHQWHYANPKEGDFALAWAIRSQQYKIIELLLNAGADVRLVSASEAAFCKGTFLDFAFSKPWLCDEPTIALLRSFGAELSKEIVIDIDTNDSSRREYIRKLLKNDYLANIAHQEWHPRKALIKADLERQGLKFMQQVFAEKCGEGDFHTVILFLEAGMSPDARGERTGLLENADPKNGELALVWAIKNNQCHIVQLLLSMDADIRGIPDPLAPNKTLLQIADEANCDKAIMRFLKYFCGE